MDPEREGVAVTFHLLKGTEVKIFCSLKTRYINDIKRDIKSLSSQ